MVTSYNYGLHNNNVCVANERLIKAKGLGYKNLYVTIKNCVQGANIIKNYVCWKACKGYRVRIITAQHTIIA